MKRASKKTTKSFMERLGPGFITGASDDDPSGIATYSQTGAQFGYTQLWTALFSIPFMIAVQEMCGRIGIVTGKGLASLIKMHYSKRVLAVCVGLLLMANTVNIGANLGAMGSAAQLLFGLPQGLWIILITVLTVYLQIMIPYKRYAVVLKYLALSLFAYVITVFLVKQDWGAVVWSTFRPTIEWNMEYIMNIVALLGTTISPYLFFWQTGEEVEEEVSHHLLRTMGIGTPRFHKSNIKGMRMNTIIGMIFSNIICFFIIVTTASTLHAHGITQINTAAEAAEALRPLAGDFTFILFAVGILGTGLLSVPVLSGSAAYALAETMGWKEGLYRSFKQAHGFYAIIAGITLGGALINLLGIPPFRLLYYTAIVNGVVSPVLIIIIIRLAGNVSIMGKHASGLMSKIFSWAIAIIMGAAALFLLVGSF